jgi:hypothetical protein
MENLNNNKNKQKNMDFSIWGRFRINERIKIEYEKYIEKKKHNEKKNMPKISSENHEPDLMEHNIVDCYVEDEWGGENVTWADSLSKNIIESVTLEIGNPVDDGYNYIKQVNTNE